MTVVPMISSNEELVNILVNRITEKLKDEADKDLIMNKKEMCKKMFNCDTKTFDEKIYKLDFPFLEKEGNKLYSKKAVANWIDNHQLTADGGKYQWN